MGVDLGQRFPTNWAGRPAHMSALDWVLWQRFRRGDMPSFLWLYFDVALGGDMVSGDNIDPAVSAAWARLTAFRADVVGEKSDGWTIIEIRAAAGPGAIGSLLSYRSLWSVAPPDSKPVDLLLVTDTMSAGLAPALSAAGVKLQLV